MNDNFVSTPQILARLTAGAVNLKAYGGRSSSRGRLIGTETAGCLKNLSQDAMDYAMAVYMCDEVSRKNVIINTERQAFRIAERGKWKIGPSQLKAMAEIAANIAMNTNKCPACNGVGSSKLRVVCKKCGGDGSSTINFSMIARAIKLEPTSFNRIWQDRFFSILDYVLMVDAEVLGKISKNTREIDTKEVLW